MIHPTTETLRGRDWLCCDRISCLEEPGPSRDVTTMLRRTAELGRQRRPKSKTFFCPWATPQDNQPTNHHPSRWATVAASQGPGRPPGGGWAPAALKY